MSDEKTLVAEQCRAARALIGWSRADLAEHASVAASTLADFEANKREPYARTLADIRRTLEAAGVSFIEPDAGGWAGVRLREAPAA